MSLYKRCFFFFLTLKLNCLGVTLRHKNSDHHIDTREFIFFFLYALSRFFFFFHFLFLGFSHCTFFCNHLLPSPSAAYIYLCATALRLKQSP